jgi:hypothetical protein
MILISILECKPATADELRHRCYWSFVVSVVTCTEIIVSHCSL